MLSEEMLDDFGEYDCPLSLSAQAVTGQDGRMLYDDIDLSPSIEPLVSQAKEPPKFSAPSRSASPQRPPQWCELPTRPPLRVRNTVTGHEFAWHPLLRLSANDDLEVIA